MFAIALQFFSLLELIQTYSVSKRNEEKEWTSYKDKYGLKFDGEEDIKRMKIFQNNLEMIFRHNSKNGKFILEMNQYGHLESHERMKGYKKRERNPIEKDLLTYLKEQAISLPYPKKVDWRSDSYVSSIKDQKMCGSCYAFSGIGAIESHYAISTGTMLEFSEQEIVDCSSDFGNQGCGGGEMQAVFQYVQKKGISLWSDYKYKGITETCSASKFKHPVKLHSYIDLPPGDETALVRAIAFRGPVAIGIDASSDEFSFYRHGIFSLDKCSSTNLDHGVLAVGYSVEKEPYLIVKNSWGEQWGEDGYIKIALFQHNMCGIATDATYPIIEP